MKEPATEQAIQETAAPAPARTYGSLLRNVVFTAAAQVVGMPLGILVNAFLARRLHTEDYGYIYLASTFAGIAFIVIEWGQAGTIPAMVARDRSRVGAYVGSGLVIRGAMLLAVYPLVALVGLLSGYGARMQAVMALIFASTAILSAVGVSGDALFALERVDVRAYTSIYQRLIGAAVVVPTVLILGRLEPTLIAGIAGSALGGVVAWRAAYREGVRDLSVSKSIVRRQLVEGQPFVALSLIQALQPSLDAILLARLGTAEAMAWYAAAGKLVGVLMFPASALANTIYPTLCRLFVENRQEYARTTGSALRTATILAVPVALLAALFPDAGIAIFSRSRFAPAEANLRVLSLFLFLSVFTMTLGSAIVAAGRQRSWALAQLACVAVSAVVDPILIPYFQRRVGNGSLGVCVTAVLSEVLMTGAALAIVPKGVFNARLIREIALALFAGCAMAATAWALARTSVFLRAPLSSAVYLGCLVATGGLDREQLASLRRAAGRRLGRRVGA